MSEGASFTLWNNIWNTNYPDWFPFDDQGRDIKFRYTLTVNETKQNQDMYLL